jgi:hypothetical protein
MLLYKNTIDFCILILYQAGTKCTCSHKFLVASLGILYVRSHYLQRETILLLPFQEDASISSLD